MSARIDVARRHSVPFLAVVAVAAVALAAAGCGGDNGPSGSNIVFTPAAMRSVPSVKPPTSTTSLLAPAQPASITDPGYGSIAALFKMQCRRGVSEGVDYCPPGTPPRPSDNPLPGQDPYDFDMGTLIGFIYHAQMYTRLVTDCSGNGLTPKTVTAASYSSASTTGSPDPTRFMFDQYSTYTCHDSNVSDGNAETRMVSAVADGSYQTTLHTRYKYGAGGQIQTDFFQGDVSMNAGVPEFLAFNFASAAPHAERLVLLANFTSHRFAMKYYVPAQPGNNGNTTEWYAVAAGVGGYDLTTGQLFDGYYYIHSLADTGGPVRQCVNNNGGVFEDNSNCAIYGDSSDTWTSSTAGLDIATYLEIPEATVARIPAYLGVFGNATDLATAEDWSTEGSTDPALYWPASLH